MGPPAMNVRTLIDAIVRQTVVLVAQLATSGGLRAPLAHVAEQVFLELATELERQGVPQKVSADMFGLALRTYQRRTQRFAQSATDRGRSLWEALFEFIRQGGVVTREELLRRFRHDDEASVKGLLRDLVESGLVFAAGTGPHAAYRLATDEEVAKVRSRSDRAGLDALVWSVMFREGPLAAEAVGEACRLVPADVEPILSSLVDAGRVERVETGGNVTYRSRELVLGLEDPAGWEAAVLDHFVAVVRTIMGKLALEQRAAARDEVGGSTYHFALWRGHPLEDEVLGELRRFRERMSALRSRIDAYGAQHRPEGRALGVTAYYGQFIQEDDDDDHEG